MATDDLIKSLSQKLPDPAEMVYAVTMRDLLTAIAGRLRSEALLLTTEDLLLARNEVREVFGHYLNEREMFDLALDQWEVVRHL